MDFTTFIIALAIGTVFGFFIGMLFVKLRFAGDLATSRAEAKAALESKKEAWETQQKNFDVTIETVKDKFENIAGKVLEEQQKKFDIYNKKEIESITSPFMKELNDLRKIIGESDSDRKTSKTELDTTIKMLMEQSKQLSNNSQNLAEALKSRGKVQGDWGEIVLSDILCESGLREGKEYEIQKNFQNDGKKFRPDVIVNSPDDSKIIIDSKVSLTAYMNYVGAENDEERKRASKENYESIWRHVEELSGKYEKIVPNAVPQVLMFVPNEGSYLLAMNYNEKLGGEALKKGIFIVSPTNLMLALKLILISWQNTRQEENYKNIIDAATKLYDKFAVLSNHISYLGTQIISANKSISDAYNKAVRNLEGKNNIISQIVALRDFGAKPTKQIQEIGEIKTSDAIPLPSSDESSEEAED